MTSIRHSDTPALNRRRELVANELRLIDAEIARRQGMAQDELRRIEHEAWAKIAPGADVSHQLAPWQESANARDNPLAHGFHRP